MESVSTKKYLGKFILKNVLRSASRFHLLLVYFIFFLLCWSSGLPPRTLGFRNVLSVASSFWAALLQDSNRIHQGS